MPPGAAWGVSMGKFREKIDPKTMAVGLTLLITGTLLIIIYMLLSHFEGTKEAVKYFFGVISPFIYGVVIAYLISPIYDYLLKRLYIKLKGKLSGHEHAAMITAKVISTVITVTAFVAAVAGFGILVVPQILDSLTSLVELIPKRGTELIEWIRVKEETSNDPLWGTISNFLQNSTDDITDWLQSRVLPELGGFVSSVYEGVWGTFKTVLNILIGVIVSVYFLNERTHFKALVKKTLHGLFPNEQAKETISFFRTLNKTFGGFISGKIIDSIIIGFICFGLMTVLGLPYSVLVSVIIGVTNVIPFFGPFIGAIPGAFIIVVVDPLQAVVFAVMIFLLQQFDGYVLGPKILGDSTGISSFWVMFSIIMGGGLCGFIGMVLAVPTFAVFYVYFKMHIEKKLAERGEPMETSYYEETEAELIERAQEKAEEQKIDKPEAEPEERLEASAEEKENKNEDS